MRAPALLLALLAATAAPPSPAPAVAQRSVDTTLAVQGFLQQDNDVGAWTIVVPLPLDVLGTRTYVVPVVGKPERWSKFVNRYIEASGRITRLPERGNPAIGMEIDKAREVVPAGTARATVSHGMTLQAEVTLSVVPNHFVWRDATGASTGVNPTLLYTIINRRAGPIFFVLPTHRFLCITVTSEDGIPIWDSTTVVLSPDARRFSMQRAGVFRDAIHVPEDAAARRGHYSARVGICDVDDYDISAEFDVR